LTIWKLVRHGQAPQDAAEAFFMTVSGTGIFEQLRYDSHSDRIANIFGLEVLQEKGACYRRLLQAQN
jgi:hypothetical protein